MQSYSGVGTPLNNNNNNNNNNNKVIYTAQIRQDRKCAFSRQF